jgi:protein gp37
MAEGTAIEWADDSWNPIRARNRVTGMVGHFCIKVSPGCKHCYAERLQTWPIGSGNRYAAQFLKAVELLLDEQALEQPLKRKRGRDIFPCSMTDLFADFHPDAWIAKMFSVMYRAPQHRFLVLTKRAERMRDFIVRRQRGSSPLFALENVWFGISAEDQERWDERAPFIDEMTRLGFNTWASFEPLLSDVNLRRWRVLWAVIGGESGNGARPTVIGHVRALLRHLEHLDIPPFVKQLGARPVNREGVPHPLKSKKGGDPAEWPEDLRVRRAAGA